jgi:hypothetical protein
VAVTLVDLCYTGRMGKVDWTVDGLPVWGVLALLFGANVLFFLCDRMIGGVLGNVVAVAVGLVAYLGGREVVRRVRGPSPDPEARQPLAEP